ncbi:E3 SUMO-protein ligase ZBED1-like [Lampetra planeri]
MASSFSSSSPIDPTVDPIDWTSLESVKNSLQKAIRKEKAEGIDPSLCRFRFETTSGKFSSDVWKKFAFIRLTDAANADSKHWHQHSSPLPGNGIVFERNSFAACLDCLAVYAYQTSNGTTTLKKHTCGSETSSSAFGQAGFLRPFVHKTPARLADKAKVKRSLAFFCATDTQPFSVVEDAGFRGLVADLIDIGVSLMRPPDLDDLLPAANTVKTHVEQGAERVRAAIRQIVQAHVDDGLHVAATTDLWTDTLKKRCFMSVTVHYVDDSFLLHARTLQCKAFYAERHTAVAIKTALIECLESYQILDPAKCFVVSDDGSSNMSAENGVRSSCYGWGPCLDHKLASVLTTVLSKTTETVNGVQSLPFYPNYDCAKDLFDLIDDCKALVAFFKQAKLQCKLTKSLKQENATSWNSLLTCLNSVLESYDEVATTLFERKQLQKIGRINKQNLADLVEFIEPFRIAALRLEVFKSPTIHTVVYERHVLLQHLAVRQSDSDDIAAIKMLLLDQTQDAKWTLEPMVIVGALLDPGLQKRLDKFGVTPAQEQAAIKQLRAMMIVIGKSQADRADYEDELPAKRPRSSRAVDLSQASSCSRYSSSSESDEDEDRGAQAHDAALSLEDEVDRELAAYRQIKLAKAEKKLLDTNDGILTWWRMRGTSLHATIAAQLPIMARVARSLLCIPASSSIGECNLSAVSNTFSKRRTMLSPSALDNFMVIQSNPDLY